MAEAAIVEEQNVEVGVVEELGVGESVCDGAGGTVEDEGGGSGGGSGGNPPAIELGLAGGVDAEVDFSEGEVEAGGGGGDVAGRLEDELPLAAVEEGTDGYPGAECGDGAGSCAGADCRGCCDNDCGSGRSCYAAGYRRTSRSGDSV